MNKAELIARLEPRLGRREASEAVDLVVDAIIREVAAGGTVTITGFGTFEPVHRAARTGRNPRTGERVPIPDTTTPRFRPGTLFKEVVAQPDKVPDDALLGGRAPVGQGGSAVGANRRLEELDEPPRSRKSAATKRKSKGKSKNKGADKARKTGQPSASTMAAIPLRGAFTPYEEIPSKPGKEHGGKSRKRGDGKKR